MRRSVLSPACDLYLRSSSGRMLELPPGVRGGAQVDGQKPDPKPHSTSGGAEDNPDDRPVVSWTKRIVAVAGAIAAIGGAVTVISQTTHLFGFLTHASSSACPSSTTFERSPNLGVSFYQNGKLDPMSSSDAGGTGQQAAVSVCMKSVPFEIWFPALVPNSQLSICASNSRGIFGFTNCFEPAFGAADFKYASGTLYEYSSTYLAHTSIWGNQAQSASGGDQKYYVSNITSFSGSPASPVPHVVSLASEHGKLYLAVYLNTNNYSTFQAHNVEDFILTFG